MSSSFNSDKQVFERLAEGNESAFRELFDLYRAPFYSAAFKLTRSADLTEEIVQEVFITLWEKRKQIAAAENPKSYLVTILHNHIYSHFRRIVLERKARQMAARTDSGQDDNPVEELLLAKENREILQTVISKLPPQQQLVYRLAKQEGLSREEIAQKLNISVNTVRNHLAAAVDFIRDYFKKDARALIWLIILEQL